MPMNPACHPPAPRRQTLAVFLATAVFLGAVYLLFFHKLGERDLWSSHEARAAQDAETILDDGRWGLPRLFDGRAELQKPPLYYWSVAVLGETLGGVGPWVVRLPAALAAAGCVAGVALLGWRRGRPVAGLVAAGVLATALHFTWLARVGRIDMPLTLTVGTTLGLFYLARDGGRGSTWCLLLAYLAVAAGLLLKGPIGAVLPAGVWGVHLLTEGRLPVPWRVGRWAELAHRQGWWWGLLLVALLTVPWFVWANAHTGGEFFRVFFWHHNVERGFEVAAEHEEGAHVLREHPWWFYGRFAIDFLPWSVLLPVAGWFFFRRGAWREDPEARFGLVWLLTVLVLLSCVRFKRADYLLPAYPGAALFLGCALERWYLALARPRWAVAAFALSVTACVVGWVVFVEGMLPGYEADREQRRFAAEVRRRDPSGRIVMFWTESHDLAFHLGRPLEILIQWEDLDARLARTDAAYVVMPPEQAELCPQMLRSARLEMVLSNVDLAGGHHQQPLVLLRKVAPAESPDAGTTSPPPHRERTRQPHPAGP
jgi:4-amino-4-deoxy-L-arabinose transferase-like glycosyltransferase